jgi:hypothetical protein
MVMRWSSCQALPPHLVSLSQLHFFLHQIFGERKDLALILTAKNKNKKILVSSKNVAIFAPQIKETILLCIYL